MRQTDVHFLFIGNNIATRRVATQTKTIKLVLDSDFIFLMKILFLVLIPASGHRNTEDGEDGEKDDVGDDARWCRDTDGGTEGGDDGDGDVVGERR